MIVRAAEVRPHRPRSRNWRRSTAGRWLVISRHCPQPLGPRCLPRVRPRPGRIPRPRATAAWRRLIDPENRCSTWRTGSTGRPGARARLPGRDRRQAEGDRVPGRPQSGPDEPPCRRSGPRRYSVRPQGPAPIRLQGTPRRDKNCPARCSRTLVGCSIRIAARPPPASRRATRKRRTHSIEQLDYALLEMEEPRGQPDSCDRRRGRLAAGLDSRARRQAVLDANPFAAGSPVLIAQHPAGEPLSLAIEWKAMIRFNAARTRVRHQTNTQAGSSGSPCFDRNWNLIALHHYGDAKYEHRIRDSTRPCRSPRSASGSGGRARRCARRRNPIDRPRNGTRRWSRSSMEPNSRTL